MYKVLLVGGGHLGSRYLQGLVGEEIPLSITVIDPSTNSLQTCRERIHHINNHDKIVEFNSDINSIDREYDLCIVSTPAHCRHEVIKTISSHTICKYWILEKVLTQSTSQLDTISKYLSHNKNVWVNTPRRITSWHRKIKDRLSACLSKPIHVQVSGGSWGLATNSIHYIDLVSWFSSSMVSHVDSSLLLHWAPSKRSGFYECFGELNISFANGSTLRMKCSEDLEPKLITINTQDNNNWSIDEATGVACNIEGEKIFGELTLQSVLTGPLVKSILTTSCCDLPVLSESVDQHRLLLNSLLNHWNQTHKTTLTCVPIT